MGPIFQKKLTLFFVVIFYILCSNVISDDSYINDNTRDNNILLNTPYKESKNLSLPSVESDFFSENNRNFDIAESNIEFYEDKSESLQLLDSAAQEYNKNSNIGWKFRSTIPNTGDYSDGWENPSGELLWKYKTDGSIISSPTIYNGVVYFGSNDNKVYALDALTGKKIWDYKTGGIVESSPAILNNVVYIGSFDNTIYALDALTGKKIWGYKTGGEIRSSPSILNGILYCGSNDNKIYALDASNGKKKWDYLTEGDITSSPGISNGLLFVGSRDRKIHAISVNSGKKQWVFPTTEWIGSCPTIINNIVYFGAENSKIYALDSRTGNIKWIFKTNPPGADSSPAYYKGIIFVGSYDKNVYALDALTGKKKWEYKTGDCVSSSPAYSNGIVYIGSWDSHLYAFDAQTGNVKWKFKTDGRVTSSPAYANGIVYIGSQDGVLYAIGKNSQPTPTPTLTPTPTSTPSSSTLVAYYSFDGGTARDDSGKRKDGVIHGTKLIPGVKGNALSFNGKSDYISLPLLFTSNPKKITMMAWAKPKSDARAQKIIYNGNYETAISISNGQNNLNAGTKLSKDGSRNKWYTATTDIVMNQDWDHISGVFDTENHFVKLFLNGELVDQVTLPVDTFYTPKDGRVRIGASDTNTFGIKEYFDGIIDEVRVYKGALTDSEIKTIYESYGYGSTPTPTPTGSPTPTVGPTQTPDPNPLVASFTASPLSGNAPLNVQFTDTSKGNPTSWSWTFGDGGTAWRQNPIHSYKKGGSYTVKLIVKKEGKSSQKILSNFVKVSMVGSKITESDEMTPLMEFEDSSIQGGIIGTGSQSGISVSPPTISTPSFA